MSTSDTAAATAEDAASARCVLAVEQVSRRFGALVANDRISLDLYAGEILGLLGENGAGKTTLINLIFGHLAPDSGTISIFGRRAAARSPAAALAAGVGLVHQHFALADNLTVLENVIAGTEPLWALRHDVAGARRRLAALAEDFGLHIEPNAKVGGLSVGERQRVEILKVLYRGARVLILDEPTAVLTPQEADGLFAVLRQMTAQGLAILFVSHKLPEITALCHRVVVLRQGRVVAAARIGDIDHARLAEAMVGHAVAEPVRRGRAAGAAVLHIDRVTITGRHGEKLVDESSLTVHAGEIAGIAGVAGNGQVPLAQALSGLRWPAGGEIRVFGEPLRGVSPAAVIRLGVGRIPEDRHRAGVIAHMSVLENLILERYRWHPFSRYGFLRLRYLQEYAQERIEALQIRCPGPHAAVRHLSGGNMQKLILARVLAHEPKIIVAAQLTRGLDVAATADIRQRLLDARDRGCAVVLISEDLDELLALSDRIAVIYRGRLGTARPAAELSRAQIGRLMGGMDS